MMLQDLGSELSNHSKSCWQDECQITEWHNHVNYLYIFLEDLREFNKNTKLIIHDNVSETILYEKAAIL